MSGLMSDFEQIVWFLREFENAENEQLEDCELEIYGEDDKGREGTCTISVQQIAKKSADFIINLQSERDALQAQVDALMKIVQDNALIHTSANSAKIGADAVESVTLDSYDAGYLSDFGGGNVGWWQDYIRSELAKAHDFYQSQVQQYADQIRREVE